MHELNRHRTFVDVSAHVLPCKCQAVSVGRGWQGGGWSRPQEDAPTEWGKVLVPADLGEKQDARKTETIMIANPCYVSSTFLNIFFIH